LDGIPGIGPKRKQELLKTFKSISGISAATIDQLERILPRDAASAVYHYFHNSEEK
jgi:excinuclease ABC subunit C